jgi:hypothetical protein
MIFLLVRRSDDFIRFLGNGNILILNMLTHSKSYRKIISMAWIVLLLVTDCGQHTFHFEMPTITLNIFTQVQEGYGNERTSDDE